MAHVFKIGGKIFKSGSKVLTVKAANYQIIATIAGIAGASGSCFDTINNRVFVSSYNDSKVYYVDADTYAILGSISGFSNPLGLTFDITRNCVYVCSNNGIYKIDVTSLTYTQVYNHNNCRFLAIDPDLSRDRFLFTDGNLVNVIKHSNYTKLNSYSLGAQEGIRFDPVASNNRFLMVNRSGKILRLVSGVDFTVIAQTLPNFIGDPIDITFNPFEANATFFITDGYGGSSVRLFTTNGFTPVKSITGVNVPVSITVNPDLPKGLMYVTNFSGNSVSVLKMIS